MRFFLSLFFLAALVAGASAQTLRAGDSIDISVWQDPKLDRKLIISPAGTISMPLAGHLRASGMSPRALEDVVRKRLQRHYSDALDVTVTFSGRQKLDDDEKPHVFVTGEVLKPGPFTLLNKTNLMQAISIAGGLGPFAAKRRIQVRRQVNGVETAFLFDYVAFESGAALDGNIDIKNGDVIIVPERGLFE
uniref:Polysaccharide export protein n=1 Tax=Rhodopseudomonas palustris (strain BisA53) TaxID=316055 RepID=Q07SP0_RHOP5